MLMMTRPHVNTSSSNAPAAARPAAPAPAPADGDIYEPPKIIWDPAWEVSFIKDGRKVSYRGWEFPVDALLCGKSISHEKWS